MRIEIRSPNVDLSMHERTWVARRMGFALGRLAGRIRRIDVVLTDLNGPRGGIDHRCRISATLAPRGRIQVEATDLDARTAIDVAARRIERKVKREIERRRDLRRSSRPPVAAIEGTLGS
jgi:ribosome-associated translation inhibitor RaiA